MPLARNYETALERHLKRGPGADWAAAWKIGRAAVGRGVETLELAQIHERAMVALGLAGKKNAFTKLAGIFFVEANTLVMEPRGAARRGKANLSRPQATLGRGNQQLAASNRELQREVARQKVRADAAAKNGKHHNQYLEESLPLQKHLRELTHRVLAAQENERPQISPELQDEIAQTLLGINVRLRSLKQKSHRDTNGFKKEITRAPLVSASHGMAKKTLPEKSLRERRSKISAQMPPATLAPSANFPVIAIAASVGGLKALSVILSGLPANFPAAIAIVMHLPPDHKSLLAEILNLRTPLVVKEAQTGDSLSPACVFIAPPNHHLLVGKNGSLKLSSVQAEKIHFARPSAEPLFASVAEVYQKKAIAIVLTGGDSDGSFGVKIIKEHGGTVIAQDRPTSENFSMPDSAIQTGEVDYILPLEEIAPMLIALVWTGHKSKPRLSSKKRSLPPALPELVTPHYAAAPKDVMLKRRK